MWYKTKLTDLLGTKYPIVQGPFGGGLSSVELAATVSNAGGLGSFGMQPFTPDEILRISSEIKARTKNPFNLNLWVNDRDEGLKTFGTDNYTRLKEIFKPYFEEVGVEIPEMPVEMGPAFSEQVEALLEARPAVFSFVYGIPEKAILDRCKVLGIITVGAATTVDEAVALEDAGVDAVVATGFEAGGHRVSFLRPAEDSLTGTFTLIPQVKDAVNIPVIAAGGIADSRGIKAALALGADGVQIGTAFLATSQSNASDDHKQKLFSGDARYTVLTKAFTGRLARGLRNRLTEELKEFAHLMAPYPMQGKFMSYLKAYPALANSNPDLKAFWAGQGSPLIKYRDARLLMETLVAEMNQ